jgi:two-component system, NarL family, sensor histidine kinase DesK
MTEPRPAATTADPDLEHLSRMWSGGGWRRLFFPAFWLVYLGQAVDGVSKHESGSAAAVGYAIIVAFAVVYLLALPAGWSRTSSRLFWWLYAAGFALTAAEAFFARDDALVFFVYLAVLTVATRRRFAMPLILAMALTAGLLPRFIPGWGGAVGWNNALSVLLVSMAMWGFFRIVQANMALAAARAEVARLAAENERSRIARDLHDLLGHSLTTITVKAGLARRLAEHGDAERAFGEIGEVEQLARRTLGDVRAAVSAHREVTLTGELATAREVLRAAGIVSELPASVEETDPALSELFGWVVREAVTNVVRHSRATHVRITLGRDYVEIYDDGRGSGGAITGNGLRGLRERVESAGGTLIVGGGLIGFRVRAEVPPLPASTPSDVPAPVPAR